MVRYIPDPYPDELIYSVWARFSDHVRYPRPEAVFRDLFGKHVINPLVDLPCHLQQFCNNLPSDAGLDVDTIIDQHTLLPYYRPFMPPERYLAIRHQMIAGTAQAIHRRTGLSGSPVARPAYLRYCPRCLEEEKATLGECYWHRLHQVPGVEVCPDHDVFLENSLFRAQANLGRKRFFPAEWIKDPAVARDARSSPFYMQLKNIAFNSAYLLNHAVPLLDVQYVRERYHTLLAQYRYLSVTGHVRSCQFIQDLQNYYPDALLALLHCEVDRPRRTHSTWPIKVVRAKESHHPLFHILTLPLLKSSAHLFFQESLNDHHPGPWRQGLWPCLNPICPHYQHLHIHACYIQRKADRTYHGTFACDCGFEYSRIISEAAPDNIYRYDKILAYGQLWEKALSALWQDTHLTRAQIARCLGGSADTIRQKVKTLGLPLRRKAMEGESMPPAEAEFALHREQWLKTLAAFPGQGVEVLIWQAADTYDWLWKYDRAWLKAHVPPRIDPQRRRTPWQGRGEPYTTGREGRILPQEWERRDRMVADEIRKRARELLEAPGAPQRVTIGKLRQDLPAFARWAQPVTQLAHFPLTKRAFDEVLESSEHFAFRRVQWVAQQCIAERKPLKQWQLVYTAGVKGNQHKPVVQEAIQAAMCQFASLE